MKDHTASASANRLSPPTSCTNAKANPPSVTFHDCRDLARRIGLQPSHDVVLLDMALTHVSYVNDHRNARSNQRLAFVGSRVISVAAGIARRFAMSDGLILTSAAE
ncbi:MAG: hypothetical protein HY699_06915 [Deltaproteobacteria bacterium]|nr:hypothetical protein [Deltaproteobacteria bacterium]